MCKKIFVILAAILFFASSADAAKIDIYRNALVNKNFTLKYEITKLPVHSSMREGELTFEGALNNKINKKISNVLHGGIIVVSGDDRYTETNNEAFEMDTINFSGLNIAASVNAKVELKDKNNPKNKKFKVKVPESGVCNLIKGGDIFQFIWSKDDNKKKYKGLSQKKTLGFGHLGYKSDEIQANVDISRTPYQDLLEEFNYGVPEIALVLMPLLPREKIIATSWTPDYKFFGTGALPNGLTYEDFVSDKDNFYSAIRYYFNGNNMVKVAIASYFKDGGKVKSYEKKIIDITEFNTSADQNYLKLPESLKDVTKRDEEVSK